MQGWPGASDGPTEPELKSLTDRLNRHIQLGLQNDIARIFDESLYADIELILGKLKVSTHKCILKTRSPRFYETLESILKKGVSKDTFIEIESFISDTYSECNIKKQEDEFLEFLQENTTDDLTNSSRVSIKTLEPFTPDSDLFLTPKTSPSCVKSSFTHNVTATPQHAPCEHSSLSEERNLLEKELTEQDELLSAFQTILKSQKTAPGKLTPVLRIKPTTLSLRSSHTSKVFKHSGSCDFSRFKRLNNSINTQKFNQPRTEGHEWANPASQFYSPCIPKVDRAAGSCPNTLNRKDNSFTLKKEPDDDKTYDDFTPDSLIDEDDDNSSPSDYLTPAANYCPSLLEPKVTNHIFVKSRSHSMPIEMENLITTVDSGLETTSASSGLVESYGSPKDHTESETSAIDFTESLFSTDPLKDDDSQSISCNYSRHSEISHPNIENIKEKVDSSLINESAQTCIGESSNCFVVDRVVDKNVTRDGQTCHDSDSPCTSEWSTRLNNPAVIGKTSSKEEKERFNEEIVFLESSSVSSETGSWESIFPPKCSLEMKDVCHTFITHERKHISEMLADKRDICIPKKNTCFPDLESEKTCILPTRNLLMEPSLDDTPRISCAIGSDRLDSSDNSHDDSLELDEFDALEKATAIESDCEVNIGGITDIKPCDEEKCLDRLDYQYKNLSIESTCILPETPSNSILQIDSNNSFMSDETLQIAGDISTESLTNYTSQSMPNSLCPIQSSWVVDMSSFSGDKERDKICSMKGKEPPEKKKSLGYYIDMSAVPNVTQSAKETTNEQNSSPSNLFTLFYEIGDNRNLKEMPSRLSIEGKKDVLSNKIKTQETKKSEVAKIKISNAKIEKTDLKKKSSPLPQNKAEVNVNRHSWNICEPQSLDKLKNFHKQKSLSLSKFSDTTPEFVNQMQAKRESNYSLTDSVQDDSVTSCSKSELSSFSESEVAIAVDNKDELHIKKKKCNAKLNETFDKSSTCSEKTNLNESSPTITDEEMTFHPENVKIEANEQMTGSLEGNIEDLPSTEQAETNTDAKIAEKEVGGDGSNFVKLSDMDKPLPALSRDVPREYMKMPMSSRMSRSIPETSWANNIRMTHSAEVFSSFHSENLYSLARLFPHLGNEFSHSTPWALDAQARSSSNLPLYLRSRQPPTEPSDTTQSSLQSSACFSGNDVSMEEQPSSSVSHKSRLGEDLLRMFLEEIAPDVTIDVDGRKIKAHKCVLSSRCLYFAGILSGTWSKNSRNVISLDGFSFDVVHFALCHIYSGASTIPDSISIFELAALSDMLSLEGLREVVMHTLRTKYCHYFHKPCPVCSVGVLECLPLSSAYGMDEIYLGSIEWVTKYYIKIWPTKKFSELPKELRDKCYRHLLATVNSGNVLETIASSNKMLMLLPSEDWSNVVKVMVRRLLEAGVRLVSAQLPAVLTSPACHDLAQSAAWLLPCVEDALITATERVKPNMACEALNTLRTFLEDPPRATKDFLILMRRLAVICEGVLLRSNMARNGGISWSNLDLQSRDRLRQMSNILMSRPSFPKNKHSHMGSKGLEVHVRRSFQSHSTGNSSTRSASSSSKTSTSMRPQDTSKSALNVNPQKSLIPRCRNSRFEKTKSRYLEPRPVYKSTSDLASQVPLSSGESSRNISPALKRAPPFVNKNVKSVYKNTELKSARNSDHSSSEVTSQKSVKPVANEKIFRNHSDTKVPKLLSLTKVSQIPSIVHKSEENINSLRSTKEKEFNAKQVRNITPQKTVSKLSKMPVVESKSKVLKKNPLNGSSLNDVQSTKMASPILGAKKNPNNKSLVDKKAIPKMSPKVPVKAVGKVGVKTKPPEPSKDGCPPRPKHSFYNPTQSTKAKVVCQPTADSNGTVNTRSSSKCKDTESKNKDLTLEEIFEAKQNSIPVMERSGTFLKDEPTVIDKYITSDCSLEMYPKD